MHRLELIQEGRTPHVVLVEDGPLLIGRAPSNDVVLTDDQVSWHHAAVWPERGKLFVRDMGSRNGTDINGAPVRGAHPLTAGDVVHIGPTTHLRVLAPLAAGVTRALLLEDLSSGVRMPLRADRFHIGSGADADLRVDGPLRAATLLIDADGEVVLATDDSALTLQVGQTFEVSGRTLRLSAGPTVREPTVEPASDRYPYRLTVHLNGPTGAYADLARRGGDEPHRVSAENRAILLYVLARQLLEDREGGLSELDAGWTPDEQVMVGVWGRSGPTDSNNLHVLVYRLRKELQKAGFDPWFIEKRKCALRVRLRDVEVNI